MLATDYVRNPTHEHNLNPARTSGLPRVGYLQVKRRSQTSYEFRMISYIL